MSELEKIIPVTVKGESYPIVLTVKTEGLSEQIEKQKPSSRRIGVIADDNAWHYHGKELEKELSRTGREVYVYHLPSGEENKNLSQVERIYHFLIQNSFDRQDVCCAFGGGVTGDMTGFAAATYLRGIDFIQIPTTLLADVDSSIGGKTGVDFENYKNMIGAFKQPVLVYINLEYLSTLPGRQISTGMAEIIKHGLIRNAEYLHFLNDRKDSIIRQDPHILLPVIEESLQIKKAVVEEDPTEKGVRAILNFGHTLGHALEKESGFTLTHGEGVALGCTAALFLSRKRGFLSREDCKLAEEIMTAFGLPVRCRNLNKENVLAHTLHDKKRAGDAIRFILLKKMGEAVIDPSVTGEEMREALDYLETFEKGT